MTYAKAIACAIGVLGSLLTANLLPDNWAHWVSAIIGALTIVATYATPNARPAALRGEHEAP